MKINDSKYSACLYFSSNAFARKTEKLLADSLAKTGLSPSHAYLLLLVVERPGIQPSELVNQLLLTPSTITRLVEKLEDRKLVVRTTEGKITNVYPTPRAKSIKTEIQACLDNFYANYTHILGKEESGKLVTSIATLNDKLPG